MKKKRGKKWISVVLAIMLIASQAAAMTAFAEDSDGQTKAVIASEQADAGSEPTEKATVETKGKAEKESEVKATEKTEPTVNTASETKNKIQAKDEIQPGTNQDKKDKKKVETEANREEPTTEATKEVSLYEISLEIPELNGTVKVRAADGAVTEVTENTYHTKAAQGEHVKLEISPKENYEIAQVQVNGSRAESTELNGNTAVYRIGDINADQNIKVFFKEKEQITNSAPIIKAAAANAAGLKGKPQKGKDKPSGGDSDFQKYEKSGEFISINEGPYKGCVGVKLTGNCAVVKQAGFAILWTQSPLTESEQQEAWDYFKQNDKSLVNGVTRYFYTSGMGASYTVSGTNGGTYYFGVEIDGATYVLAPSADKVSHFNIGNFEPSGSKPVTLELSASKTVGGQIPTATEKFSFKAEPVSAPAGVSQQPQTVENQGGSVTFSFTYDKEGEYVYRIREVKDSGGKAYVYDDKVYYAKIKVTSASGSLKANIVGFYTNSACTQTVTGIEFSNSRLAPITASFKAKKHIDGKPFQGYDGLFKFKAELVNPGGIDYATRSVEGTNTADGDITIGPVTLEQPGTYIYQLSENAMISSSHNFAYDQQKYYAEVKVVANGERLSQTITYYKTYEDGIVSEPINTEPVFNNTTPEILPVNSIFTANKTVDGKIPGEDQIFSFKASLLSSSPDRDGAPDQILAQNKGNEVSFGLLQFTKPGTFLYKIEELPNPDNSRYVYDSTSFYVKVVVWIADGAQDRLMASRQYYKDETFTSTVAKVAFDNKTRTASVSGTKTWIDGDNESETRPGSITVRLMRDNEEIDHQVVTPDPQTGNWTYSFSGLPEFDTKGKAISYTVEEDNVEGYETEYQKTEEGLDIVNTLKQVNDVSVSGVKTWEDHNNAYQTRPDQITLTLYGDGQKVDEQIVRPDEDGSWRYAFSDLPRYSEDTKKEINYTVKETMVGNEETESSGYLPSYIGGSREIGIVNTLIEEYYPIEGEKVWVDDNNVKGLRPEFILVDILANGTVVDTIRVSPDANGDWKYIYEPEVYYDKEDKPITYTLREREVPGYTASYAADSFNIINTLNKEEGPPEDVIQYYYDNGGDDGNKTVITTSSTKTTVSKDTKDVKSVQTGDDMEILPLAILAALAALMALAAFIRRRPDEK
ncbi:Cna B-type domain-containing protein [Anaerovorax odorimutans]|uniref:Cna B-type domain-containing protein n=1 Tax=Anaerovorax odorimutans TaxID=109327 RepID=A0ABT1RQU5_9FIRM|nr:Cna B-type domain-containing protein [Anaerovorax odorimutans]MCQ4637562.1 Cna B-type domain-containing protein [Anaerovorax odorimutans]